MKRPLVDSRNPIRGEGGDIELDARTSIQIICVCDCSLSCSTLLAITYTFVFLLFALAIHSSIIYTCRFSLSQSRRQLSISTHCLEEYRGEVLEPFIENSALYILILVDHLDHSNFNCCVFTLFVIRLALHLFTPF